MHFPFGETVTLHKFGSEVYDDRGQLVEEYEDIDLEGVAVFPGTTKETSRLSGAVVVTPTKITIPQEVDISNHDEFTVRGNRYKVTNDVAGPKINPWTGTSFGTTIELERVNG